jgi:hypothetical protein
LIKKTSQSVTNKLVASNNCLIAGNSSLAASYFGTNPPAPQRIASSMIATERQKIGLGSVNAMRL